MGPWCVISFKGYTHFEIILGLPLSWMLASEGTESMLRFYLITFRDANPTVCPRFFMTDKDRAQMNAISIVYPLAKTLLCWWHVLHAFQQHFHTNDHPELWQKLKQWVRVEDKEIFENLWEEIQGLAPSNFVNYLSKHWMNEVELWSAVYRKDRTIHELSDTNMLLEA